MPTPVGIDDFAAYSNRKSWMPTFVGMTWGHGRRTTRSGTWY
jgi:hypothetical protein